MKKLVYFALSLFTLALTTPSYAQKKNHSSKTTQTSTITLDSFAKKWGTYYEYFCDGQIQYGWPKQFFLDLMKVMPNHFKMVKAGTEAGMTVYAFALILPNNYDVNTGAIGFKGTKMYQCELNRWTLDTEYAQQLRQQLDWKFDINKP